jgi:hypothetical protein
MEFLFRFVPFFETGKLLDGTSTTGRSEPVDEAEVKGAVYEGRSLKVSCGRPASRREAAFASLGTDSLKLLIKRLGENTVSSQVSIRLHLSEWLLVSEPGF